MDVFFFFRAIFRGTAMDSQTRIGADQLRLAKSFVLLMVNCVLPLLFANVADATQMQGQRLVSTATQAINFASGNQPAVEHGISTTQESYLESRVANLEAQIRSLQLDSTGRANGSSIEHGQPGFYFGAAAVWAKPHFKEAFQYSQTNVITGQQTLFPFQYEYDATPRIWAGIRNSNGVGIRGTHWSYDATGRTSTTVSDGINIYGAHAVTIIFPANIFAAIPGSTMQNQDSLETQITDLYATFDAAFNSIKVSSGVGLRYARLLQSLSSVVSGPAPASLNWTREYHGLGPSVMLDASRRIACTRFSGVAKGSGAFLFGKKTINRTVFGDLSPQPASPFLALDEADEVVGIGEAGFGLQWSTTTNRGAEMVLRGIYEGSLWAEAGAPTLGFLGFQGFGLEAEFRR